MTGSHSCLFSQESRRFSLDMLKQCSGGTLLNKSHPRNQIFARQVKNLVGFFLVNICLAGCLATPQCSGAHDPEVVSSVIELGCCSNAFDCLHQASDSPRGFHRRVCIGLADQDKGLKNLGIAKAVTAVPCDVSPVVSTGRRNTLS